MKYLLCLVLLFASLVAVGQTYSKDLEKAAKKGDVAAQRDLGICYLTGSGTKANDNKAYEWLVKAASQGDGGAQFYIGKMCELRKLYDLKVFADCPNVYVAGRAYTQAGGRESYTSYEPRHFYQLAAENGWLEAQYWMAANSREPQKWYEMAANSGDAEAQYKYGVFLCEGGVKMVQLSNELQGIPKAEFDKVYDEAIKQIKQQQTEGKITEEMANQAIAELNKQLGITGSNAPNAVAKEWFEKAAAQGHEGAKAYLLKLEEAERQFAIQQEKERQEREQAARELEQKLRNYRNIKLEKPNSILSALPSDILPKIDSLTIIGFMYETDLKVLGDCQNLRYLDLSKSYITYSPEKQKEIAAEGQYMASLFKFMGEAADAKFNNYEMGVLDHAYVKGFAKLMEQSYNVKDADDGCIIPTYAMCNMMKLETLILPTRASKIGGQTFKNCKALKHVKLPPYLKAIGSGAFYGCESLESIDFPASLTTIGRAHTDGVLEGEGSFMKTGLKKIDLSKCSFEGNYNRFTWYLKLKECPNMQEIKFPSGVERIHLGARQNKKSLTFYVPSTTKILDVEVNVPLTIHFASPTPPRYDTYKIPENSTVYVPKGSMTAYYSAYGNSNKYIEE